MSEQLVMVPPSKVLAEDNARFNLKPARVASLASSILEAGGVLQPVEVEPIVPPQNGFDYRLTSGFYRHAALEKLNKEQGAGLMLPAIVRPVPDAVTRLKHQLMENMERENQSPMDQAVAIKKLMDAGISRQEIRRIFSRPAGKKGVVQPASNSWLNITLRLLDLPKTIQEKIHDGRVGFAAAYELGKVSPDKRQTVLERAEAERAKFLEAEERDEEKYLAAEKRAQDAESKEKESLSAAEQAKLDVEQAKQILTERTEALKELNKQPYLEMDEKDRRVLTEKIKGGQADVKAAQKLVKDAQNKVAKLLTAAQSAAELAEEQRAKLEAARKAIKPKLVKGRGKGEAIGQDDIKRAAKAEGGDTGLIALSASEMRQAVKDVAANKEYPKVAAVGKVLKHCFDGGFTPKEVVHELALITGEEKPKGPQAVVKQ